MFTSSPRYSTLAQQVANALENEIRQGNFKDNLPGERWLAESMQVSRRTVRAIQVLQNKNVLRPGIVRQHRIGDIRPQTAVRQTVRSIGLLLPDPLDKLPPYSSVFFDYLRALLYADGIRLDTTLIPTWRWPEYWPNTA